MRILLALALLISGCSNNIKLADQVMPGVAQECWGSACPPPEHTAEAIQLWIEYSQDEVFLSVPDESSFDDLVIEWYDYENQITGRTMNTRRIQIFDRSPGDVAGSALTHELTHCYLWRTEGDPDVNHEEEGGPWHLIQNEFEKLVQRLLIEYRL